MEEKNDAEEKKLCPPLTTLAPAAATTTSTPETTAATCKVNNMASKAVSETQTGQSKPDETSVASPEQDDVTPEALHKQSDDGATTETKGINGVSASNADAQAAATTDTPSSPPPPPQPSNEKRNEQPSKPSPQEDSEDSDLIRVSMEDLTRAAITLQKYGRVILCGPPGSGKTSMGYALLNVFREKGYIPLMSMAMCRACHMGLTEGGGPKRICLVDGMLGETRCRRDMLNECRSFVFNTQRIWSRTEFNALLVVTVLPNILREMEMLDEGADIPLSDPRGVVHLTRNPVQPELPFVPRVENYVPLLHRMLRDPVSGNTLSALLGLTMQGYGFFLHHPPPIQKQLEVLGYRDVSCYGLAELEDLLKGFIFADSGKGFASRTVYEGAGLALGRNYAFNMLLSSCDAEFLTKYVRNDPDARATLTSLAISQRQDYRRELMTEKLYEEMTAGHLRQICQHPSLAYPLVLQELQDYCSATKNFTERLMSTVDAEHSLPLLYWSVWSLSPHLNHWCLTELNRQIKREKALSQSVFTSLLASVLFAESGDSSLVEAADITKQACHLKFRPEGEALTLTLPVPTVRPEDAKERLDQVRTRLKTSLCYLQDPELPLPPSLLAVSVSEEAVTVELPSSTWYLVLRLLTDRQLEEADEKGNTVLHVAAQLGESEVIAMALRTRASVLARNGQGLTPPQLAAKRKHAPGKAAGSTTEPPKSADLHAACKAGDAVAASFVLCLGVSVDKADSTGSTPLHTAVQEGHADLVSLLVQLGADVNTTNDAGATPLHDASTVGEQGMVKILLDQGAQVKVQDRQGLTPLHAACSHGHSLTAALLAQHHADVNAKDKEGQTPLLLACHNGHTQTAQLLLQLKAHVDTADKSGNTALHKAAETGRAEIVGLLLKHGADVHVKNDRFDTPLHKACEKGSMHTVRVLLHHDSKGDPSGHALRLACRNGFTEIVQLLLEHGGLNGVNASDVQGFMPLHSACFGGKAEILRLLLERNANVNAVNDSGDTALHLAIRWTKPSLLTSGLLEPDSAGAQMTCDEHKAQLAKVLLEYGADVNKKNSAGETPADMVRNGNLQGPVFENLLSHAT